MGGCEGIKTVFVYKRTGSAIPMQAGRDVWWHDAVANQPDTCEPTWVERRASAVHPLHVGLDRQAEGRPAFDGRLPAAGDPDDEVDVRLQADRRLLVHGRRGLGHRPHVHRLRPAGVRRDRDRVRGRADVSGRRPLLEDDPGPQGHGVLHGAHGDPLADQGRRRPAEEIRPVVAAHPRHGRRADQSGSVDVVLPDGRRLALPDRRHVVADRDRRPPDHAAAGRDAAQARLVHVPAAGHHRRHRRRDRAHRSNSARAASSSSSARGRR